MFETPLFLIAAAIGALIPLILHLMQKKKTTPVVFPTLRFLKLAQQASSRRIRIEHLLLWLLRTSIMALLGMAFAMPILRTHGIDFLGRAPRDIAIVLDASYSMGYQAGRNTVWENAVEIAVNLIEELGENDRYSITIAKQEPHALIAEPISDKEEGVAQLTALQLGYDTSHLGTAINAAYETLRDAPGRRLRELHVITDNQALPWESVMPRDEEADKEIGDKAGLAALQGDDDTTVFVSLLGVRAPENVAPYSIELAPPVQYAGGRSRLTVELGHSGPPRETTVSLYLSDEETSRRSVLPGTTEAEAVEFSIPSLPPGVHAGRVQVPEDNLPVDDAFHFLVRVRDQLPALVVGAESDTFFLRTALRAAADGGVEATWLEPDALAEASLSDHSIIFLCNALPLSGQEMEDIERFVRRGGLLVIFPGLRATPEDYEVWRSLPGTPGEVEDVPRTQRTRNLMWTDPNHPILRGLQDAVTSPTIALQRRLTWTDFEEDTEFLISLGETLPMMAMRPFGQGRVVMFSVSADRSWSNFPLTPFYLPVMMQLVEYAAGLDATPPYLWGRKTILVEEFLPDAPDDIAIYGPNNETIAVRSVRQDGETVLFAEDMRRPGIYRVRDTTGSRPVVAINVPRAESNLSPLEPDAIRKRMNARNLHIATDRESLADLLHEHRIGRTLGEQLLWIVLLLMAAEFVYANHLARLRRQGEGIKTVTPDGHVRASAAKGAS